MSDQPLVFGPGPHGNYSNEPDSPDLTEMSRMMTASIDPRALPGQVSATSTAHTGPAPIATPEEVAAALNVLSRASGLGYTVHAALDIVLPALSALKADNERLNRSWEADFTDAETKNARLRAQIASLTETVGKLREALEPIRRFVEAHDRYHPSREMEMRFLQGPDGVSVTWGELRALAARAALTTTEPEAKETTNGRPVSV